MKALNRVVRTFLSERKHLIEPHGQNIWTTMRGDHGVWHVQIVFNEDDRWLICRSLLPVPAPPRLRSAVSLFLTRCNDHLILGNFEMDLDDGEVAFKTSLRLTDDELTDSLLDDLLYGNCATFDHRLPGFLAMIHGRRSASWAWKLTSEPAPKPDSPTPEPHRTPGEDTSASNN